MEGFSAFQHDLYKLLVVISGTHKRDQFPKNNLQFLVVSADPVTLKTKQKCKTFPVLMKCFH